MEVRKTMIVTLAKNEEEVAELLNHIAWWIEIYDPTPNGFDDPNTDEIYTKVSASLSDSAKKMLRRLTE